MVEPHRSGKRQKEALMATRIAAALATLAIVVAATLVSASPAHAHTRWSAVYYGCGSGYSQVSDGVRPLTVGPDGPKWGEIILAYNSGNGYNCAVTRSTHWHGTPTTLTAWLRVRQSNGTVKSYNRTCTACYHWESVKAYGSGMCVKTHGVIGDDGDDFAYGGHKNWGHCGS